jgi:hypothetical protein
LKLLPTVDVGLLKEVARVAGRTTFLTLLKK